jgi:hypothetical protein
MQLSKSEYMMFLKHPAWLWLKKHDKTKLPPVDANTQAIFDAGNLFETYAEKLFPNGIRLGFNDYDEYLSLPQRTQQALQSGATTIFQGRFEHVQLTFICDVIDVVGEKEVDLYEIKSSTKAKPEHEFDLAYQMVVLEGCGFTVRNIAVVHVNNAYIRNGEVDPIALTKTTDITESVKAKREITLQNIKGALDVINSVEHPSFSPSLASTDSFGEWLSIYKVIRDVGKGSIYDLCALNADTVKELEEQGIEQLVDIPNDFALKPKQQLQLEATEQATPIVHREKIKAYLDTFTYPLYFFDYETLASIVPYFDGIKPYQQVPFQYSLHVIDTPGAEPRHVEYLHRDNSNPAEPLSKTLRSHIGENGTVITWNMSFEKGCNTLLGTLVPKYAEFYETLNNRIVDLMVPFSNCWYVDGRFHGSSSIKNVLPALVPKLSYKVLGIQEGAGAQRLWMEAVLDGKHNSEKEQILSDLIEYCGLDTMAMVKIYDMLLQI